MSILRLPAALTLAAALSAAPAIALEESAAIDFAGKVISEVEAILSSTEDDAAKISAFHSMMNTYVDMQTVARFALGAPWRDATDIDKAAYLNVFDDYLAQKYGTQFGRMNGYDLTVDSAFDAGRRGVIVKSTAQGAGTEPVGIEWQLSDRTGEIKLYDIVVEGISLLTTERQEIGTFYEQSGNDLGELAATLTTKGGS